MNFRRTFLALASASMLCACGGRTAPDRARADGVPAATSAQRPAPAASPQPAPVPTPAEPATVAFPPWWLAAPVEEGGFVSVCAYADRESMAAARSAALAAARDALAKRTNQPPIDEVTRIDAAPLPAGGFRAFVRLAARR